MADTVAELVAYVRADTSDFDRNIKKVKSGLGDLSSALIGIGGAAEAAIAPMVAALGVSVMAASDNEIALTKLDAVLKSTALHIDESSRVSAHWATITSQASDNTKSWESSITSARTTIEKYDYALAHGQVTQAQHDSAIRSAQTTIGFYTEKLDQNTTSTKTWIGESVKSTGATHMARQAYIDLAQSLQGVTRFSDETILRGEALLLTFTNIGKDIFPEVTKATLNMSEALGQDVKTSAIQLGKALQNPITGLTNLRRVGVQFTVEQEKSIRQFMAQNDLMSAQKVILAEVATEFGGMAEAMGATFSGRLEQLKNALRDIAEQVGYALLPALTSAAQFLGVLAAHLGAIDPAVIQFIAGIVGIVAALGAISIAAGLLLTPIGVITSAVTLLAAAFATNFGGIRSTVETVIGAIRPQLEELGNLAGQAMNIIAPTQPVAPTMPAILSESAANVAPAMRPSFRQTQQSAAAAYQHELEKFSKDKAIAEMPLGDRLRYAFEQIWPKVQPVLEDLKNKLSIAIGAAINGAVNWIFNTGIPAIIGAITAWAAAAWVWLTTVAPGLVAQAWENVKTAFVTGVGNIAKFLINTGHGDVVTNANTLFTDISNAFETGKNLIAGTLEGISKDMQPHIDKFTTGLSKFLHAFDGADLTGIRLFLETIGKVLGIGFVVIATVFGSAIKGMLDALGTALPLIGAGLRDIVDAFNLFAKGDILGGVGKLVGGMLMIGGSVTLFPITAFSHTVDELFRAAGLGDKHFGSFGDELSKAIGTIHDSLTNADWKGAFSTLDGAWKPIQKTLEDSAWKMREAWANADWNGAFGAIDTQARIALANLGKFFDSIIAPLKEWLAKPDFSGLLRGFELVVGKVQELFNTLEKVAALLKEITSQPATPPVTPPNMVPTSAELALHFAHPEQLSGDVMRNLGVNPETGGQPQSHGGFRGLDTGVAGAPTQVVAPDEAAITASVSQALQNGVRAGAEQAQPINIAALKESLSATILSTSEVVILTAAGVVSAPIQNDINMLSIWLNTIGRMSLITSMVGLIASTKAAVLAAAPDEIGAPIKIALSLAIDWINNVGKSAAGAAAKGVVSVMGGEFAKVGEPLVMAVAKALLAIAHMFDLMPFGVGIGAAAQLRHAASARASGGHVTAGGLYDVNEFGGEGFVPDVSGTVVPAHQMRRNAQASTGQSVTIGTLVLQGIQDAEAFLDEMEALQRTRGIRVTRNA